MTATFGLQGVHEIGADEFDALLEDVHNAGLSGVVGDTCWKQLLGFWSNITQEVQEKRRH